MNRFPELSKPGSAGFAATAVIGLVLTMALATTVMMNMAQTSAKVSGTITKHSQTTDTLSILSIAAAQNSKFEGPGGISWPQAPVKTPKFTDPGAGLVPTSFGASQNDGGGYPIKYCAFTNGGMKTVGSNEVAPLALNVTARSFYEVKNAPSFALIAAGRNGIIETKCVDLLTSDETSVRTLKTATQLAGDQRVTGSDDVIVARTVDQSNGIQGEGVKNLMTNLTSCDWKTQKLVYNDVGGQAQFDCVSEQDQNVTAASAGTGINVLKSWNHVESQYGKPSNDMVFRSLKAGNGVSIVLNGDDITINSTGGGAPNAPGAGVPVLNDTDPVNLKLRRFVGAGSVTVTEKGDQIEISGTATGGTDPNIGQIISCAQLGMLWNGTACVKVSPMKGTFTRNPWQQEIYKNTIVTYGTGPDGTGNGNYATYYAAQAGGYNIRAMRSSTNNTPMLAIPPRTKFLRVYAECQARPTTATGSGSSWVHIAFLYPKRPDLNLAGQYGVLDPASVTRVCYLGVNSSTSRIDNDMMIPVPDSAFPAGGGDGYLWFDLGTNGEAFGVVNGANSNDSRAKLRVEFYE